MQFLTIDALRRIPVEGILLVTARCVRHVRPILVGHDERYLHEFDNVFRNFEETLAGKNHGPFAHDNVDLERLIESATADSSLSKNVFEALKILDLAWRSQFCANSLWIGDFSDFDDSLCEFLDEMGFSDDDNVTEILGFNELALTLGANGCAENATDAIERIIQLVGDTLEHDFQRDYYRLRRLLHEGCDIIPTKIDGGFLDG